MKPRARYTPRLRSWAFWATPDGWSIRLVGFGNTLEQACEDWLSKTWERRQVQPGAAAVPAATT